jgi:hypothetical protein
VWGGGRGGRKREDRGGEERKREEREGEGREESFASLFDYFQMRVFQTHFCIAYIWGWVIL